jgi:hypothetical protein
MGDEVKTGVVKGDVAVAPPANAGGTDRNPSPTGDGTDKSLRADPSATADGTDLAEAEVQYETVLGVDANGRYRRFLKEVD